MQETPNYENRLGLSLWCLKVSVNGDGVILPPFHRTLRSGPNFPDSLAALLRLILSLSRRQFDALVAAMGFEGCSAAQA